MARQAPVVMPAAAASFISSRQAGGGKSGSTLSLHRFVGSDGAEPGTSLILDDKSNIYGTTLAGGTYGGGVAFELTP